MAMIADDRLWVAMPESRHFVQKTGHARNDGVVEYFETFSKHLGVFLDADAIQRSLCCGGSWLPRDDA